MLWLLATSSAFVLPAAHYAPPLTSPSASSSSALAPSASHIVCPLFHEERSPVASSTASCKRPAVRSRCRCEPLLMAKGRKQGGGPKIALKKKSKKTEAQRASERRLAALARAESTRKRAPVIGAGRQSERYAEQMSQGGTRISVYARVSAGDSAQPGPWTAVGDVCVARGASTSPELAARLQKRLILAHAARMHPLLQRDSSSLECGVGEAAPAGSDGAEPTVRLLESGAQPTAEKAHALAASCGFLGLPIPERGHFWAAARAEKRASDSRKVTLNAFGDSAKSVIAKQLTETLGLRGS